VNKISSAHSVTPETVKTDKTFGSATPNIHASRGSFFQPVSGSLLG